MPSTPICLCLTFHPRMWPCFCHLPQTLPLLSTGTNTHQGAHTHARTHAEQCFSVLSRFTVPTSQPPWPNFKVTQPQCTWLGLPERHSPGSRVTGSRGLKLILSLWSRSALFSLLSSCSAPYRSLVSWHLQRNWKKCHFSLFSPCLLRWKIPPLVHDTLSDKET